ncbi:ATP12 family chaperone protein [uncultured Croceicoccus sp.]|uniref:ATP12 family chaperone protein n=1 Tax=uncultured Croceicoccus sp. TaxID=1295329 RepID=UPI002610ED40|nr:ATP12 family chaperone protein [uncultured Croceicoccus sp.]
MKRFYSDVHVDAQDGGWQVRLDMRPLKTAGGAPQIVPARDLAEALADEWRAQEDEIDPAGFPLRDMADYAIDRVAPDRRATIAKLLSYAETDTLCYRADEGDALRTRQDEAWEPLLTEAERRYEVHFERIGGIVHRRQPDATMTRLRDELDGFGPFVLTGLLNLAGLACSLTVAMAAQADDADADALWAIANLEEDWQAVQWGWDSEALENRNRRLAGFALALRFAQLSRGG